MRTVSADRGDKHGNRDDDGRERGRGRSWPGWAHVAATQARRGAAAASGRGPGTGLAFAGRDGRDALGLARRLSGGGEASLATRPTDGQALQSERLKARLGEMLLERELLEAKVAALKARAPAL